MNRTVTITALTLLAALVPATASPAAQSPRTVQVNVDSNELPASGDTHPDDTSPDISGSGRYVAFDSRADNLSNHDSDGTSDVFVRDMKRGRTYLISQSSSEVGGNSASLNPSISANGRWVVFSSQATNLVGVDANGSQYDVFLRDRKRGLTYLISQSSSEVQGDALSHEPSVSDNGRFVAFQSQANNLIDEPPPTGSGIFVRDRRLGRTHLISRDSTGAPAAQASRPAISATGRFVAFFSDSDNLSAHDDDSLINVYLRDRRRDVTHLISQSSAEVAANETSFHLSISANGRLVAFSSGADNLTPGDTDSDGDVFVRNIRRGTTSLVSVSSAEVKGNGTSGSPSLSRTGRFVAFTSGASNLTGNDPDTWADIFVRDRKKGRTYYVSQTSDEQPSDGISTRPAISGNARHVTFISEADNLSSTDNDAFYNVFRRGRLRY